MSHLHVRPLYSGQLLRIVDVTCRAPVSACGAEEYASSHHVVFTRAGVFVKHQGRRQIVADATHALFFNRGEPFQVSHPVAGGDDCTLIGCADRAWTELVGRHDPAVADRPDAPFTVPRGRIPAPVLLRYHGLRRSIRESAVDPLEIEETSFELLDAVLGDAYTAMAPGGGCRVGTRGAHRDLAEHVKLVLATDPARHHSLVELAALVLSSPFHLARVFREQVGVPIHQYVLRLRLALALEQLANGRENLSAIAYELGFASHSHFTTLFHRAFAVTPSAYRRARTWKPTRVHRAMLHA